MNTPEQDWIDKYRAAAALAKPNGGNLIARMKRRFGAIFGRPEEVVEVKNKEAVPVLCTKVMTPADAPKSLQEDTAA